VNWTKKHPVAAYFILAYLISWATWSPLVLSAQGLIQLQIHPAWHLAGSLGPFLSSFIVTAITGGWEGIRNLLGRMFSWKVGIKWWLVALSPVALYLIAVLIDGLIQGSFNFTGFGKVNELPGLYWPIGWLLMISTFGLGEETGWRGFALPRLQKGRSAMSATLILVVFWLGWHIPMFFYKESFIQMGFPGAVGWAVSLAFGAVVLTWLYNSSQGSILMTIIWHGTFNAATSATEGNVAMIISIMVIIWGVVIARRCGPAELSCAGKHTL
jgi:membrane protease YdiL (CAAX protease family)